MIVLFEGGYFLGINGIKFLYLLVEEEGIVLETLTHKVIIGVLVGFEKFEEEVDKRDISGFGEFLGIYFLRADRDSC